MTETKKYVRILKAPYRSIWYANQIGSTFPSLGTWENTYKVDSPDKALYIRQEDAKLIVTEKRPAKRHDRILITNADTLLGGYKNGDELIVDMEFTFGNGVFAYEEYDIQRLVCYYVTHKEYEVIVNNEVKNEEADVMENKLLIENAKTVFERKDDKYFGYKSRLGDIVIGGAYSYAFVVHYAKTNEDVVIIPGDANTVTTPVCTTEEERLWKPEKTAQERRDEIVKQAKADVEKLSNRHRRSQYCGYSVEFRVNNEKRTIVVLLKGVNTGIVYARGITKAAPDDCFNVHIGKAIALHRALGLEVPDEYLNAPNPTEVRVGDVVAYPSNGRIATVVDDSKRNFSTHNKTYLATAQASNAKIIDDSRTEAI
ncbi:hypothetical protein P4284_22780 [Bacillus swezeyi]|uniref:hypothetical protein n=1 Tax=Bacillus swezeyi TaxID=1925020 RepID=UPI002E1C6577|nr:hypothetical protein [Bacillus swezeyi]MED2979489.1 hypothetical protein [Bacillus swezeyi]